MDKLYVITGATGNTGKIISQSLLDEGKRVRVLSRSEEKLAELKQLGAETAVGEPDDAEFLRKAFAGAHAVYALIPPHFTADDYRGYQNKVADALCDAIRSNNVPYAVTLSSVGAHLPEKAGVVGGLHDMEQKFNKIEHLNVVHLRPTYFMENILGQAGVIKQMGVMGSPVKGDMKFAMVATQDIAAVAADYLSSLNFSGKSVRYIMGPRDVTYNEVAKTMGKAIGIPDLRYVQVPYADARQVMIHAWGVSESLADAMVEFVESMNEGRVFTGNERIDKTTSPTSLEDFAPVFAHVYKQQN